MSNRTIQIILVLGAIALILGLVFAPRLPAEVRPEAKSSPINLKISRAVTLVQNGENPMEGIMLLREVLEEDSTNVDAHWHLAQFSITSRQIENAESRFEKVLKFDKNNKYPEALFWLAQTKLALDKPQEAVPLLEEYIILENDTIVLNGVQRMLDQLKGDNIE